ncbi:MAG: hypothetical protein Q3979_02225 [Actinomycetaceae bacterium]|nr:hypothetical protein [Actinomycetaceae bacterium]
MGHKKRTRWRDPRLAAGIALVALSGLAGAVVLSGPPTTKVYQAKEAVLPGTPLSESNLKVVEVEAKIAGEYVGPRDGQATVGVTVRAGEFVPRSSLEREESETRRVVVPLMAPPPGTAAPGERAELWRVSRQDAGTEGQAQATLLTPEALVVSVGRDESALGGEVQVEIDVPREAADEVLAVMGSQDGYVLVGSPS